MLRLPAHKPVRNRGFSLLEVVVALAVLWVGVLCAEALGVKMMATGRQSKYMSLASTLASEKLEDLNHYSPNDPQVCVPTGSASVGSLSSDSAPQSVTCPPSVPWSTGFTGTVTYNDNVNISLSTSTSACPNPTAGCFSETVSGLTGGANSYTTTYHSPDGQITPVTSSTAPTNVTFHRRWIIEANQPVTGTRRVTVLVTLLDTTVQPTVTFQMSLVRP
jgi:Tfp pilus assembly protein PilV